MNITQFDTLYIERLRLQQRRIDAIFRRFTRSISEEMRTWGDNSEAYIDERIDALEAALLREMRATQRDVIGLSDRKNREIIRQMAMAALHFGEYDFPNFDLSDVKEQTKNNVMLFVLSGAAVGLSTSMISRRFNQMLNNSDKMFYNSVIGEMIQPLAEYSVGVGTYKSPLKTAMRKATTEANIAYRERDFNLWSQMSMVMGYRVIRSRWHVDCPMCDALAGVYPKDFKFTGWHPNCICLAIPLIDTIDDIDEPVNDVPDGFKQWINEHSDSLKRQTKRGTLPHFMRNNTRYIRNILK